jgi:DNA-directed RNA polymerase II subunit RPB2
MYNGFTGDQMQASIFIGPTFYERLKHMVADKINYRQVNYRTIYNNEKEVLFRAAPVSVMTRQPTKGRGNNGGLRIGEMEKDSILSHGMLSFLKESLMERSDKFEFQLDNKNNWILDGQMGDVDDLAHVSTPYAFKQLLQEIASLGIKPMLYTQNQHEHDDDEEEDADILV